MVRITSLTNVIPGNANQNHIQFSPHSCKNDYHQEPKQQYWHGCRERRTLIHCWWECKLVQPLRKTVWRLLKKKINK
jgi:hypothetical protein